MRIGKTTHNIHVTEREYLELKKKYPTGSYHTTDTLKWFTLEISSYDALTDLSHVIEIVFWRNEKED